MMETDKVISSNELGGAIQEQGISRAFFFGAGASRADGFPLTRDIVYGVADVITRNPAEYRRLLRMLRNVFRITDEDLRRGGEGWREFVERPEAYGPPSQTILLPDIVELLSLLDVLINEDSHVAGVSSQKRRSFRAFSPREVARVRESISRAVATAFAQLAQKRSLSGSGTTWEFVRSLSARDTLITTNWDLLLDKALHNKFGTTAAAVGSDVLIVNEFGNPAVEDQVARTPLFKLHGSLNWLTCHRCSCLYVNPTKYIAELGFQRAHHGEDWSTCDCKMPLSALLITPTYFKQYRNRHLLNIWAHAQERLASSDAWYFVGYSLPTDDVHIRALLLRALHMRLDAGKDKPRITIVTDCENEEMRARYARLFREVHLDPTGFSPSTGMPSDSA